MKKSIILKKLQKKIKYTPTKKHKKLFYHKLYWFTYFIYDNWRTYEVLHFQNK